ncbi:NAD-dependent epimerase/dehydratase family protein [Tessaracoccus sp. OH4464_COT-324]|uniref:NAD-dependent epimerase/dehydratase family protein n=1 Tax=Tessaracoccus sp. OH4464_COT-324 TaxID=2491059 RepID=UPI001319BC76|nr:NAD-dependent epimerase/dehydratase family protein [Tessaracoccus sp. OH4464_COT-324]
MRILVTGASGFLGGRVAQLLAEKHEVVASGRTFSQRRHLALTGLGVEILPADLTRPDELARLLRGVDAVVHCAALSTLWGRWADLKRTNIDTSRRLAEACAARGTRLVHISSPSIYNRAVHEDPSWGTPARPVPETLPVGPRFDSAYARSKWLSERAVLDAHPDACCLRPRGIYGPGDSAIMPRIVAALRAGRLPRLVPGDVLTDLTHVDNAAHAARLAVESTVTGPVNIADGDPIAIWASINQVADALGVPRPSRRVPAPLVEAAASAAELLARGLGRSEPKLTAAGIRLLTHGLRLDLTRARDELGYRPINTEGLGSVLDDLAPTTRFPAKSTSTTTVQLEHLAAGWCVAPGALAQRGESWRQRRFPAGVTLIRHPKRGLVLFDTGYSRAAVEAVRRWPAWLYGKLLPIHLPPGEALVEQLQARGEDAASVTAILCSHLHLDHLAGTADFPDAPVWLDPAEISALSRHNGLAAVRHGIVPDVVPARERLRPLGYTAAPAWLAPFTRAMDFFGDGSLWVVPSPGHTHGSVSVVARTATDNRDGAGLTLIAGDVAWSERALRDGLEPHWLTRRIVAHSLPDARRSAAAWRRWLAQHPKAKVVVSHDLPAG